jgi:transcriptional regulator with XRE-family HTH domain
MSDIGNRLKAERERLELSQTGLAELVDASKRTVIEWEKGNTSPNAVQLSSLAEQGFDIQFIVTGVGSKNAYVNYLTVDEAKLIEAYRKTEPASRSTVLQVCDAVSAKYEVEYVTGTKKNFSSEDDHQLCQRLRIERERLGLTPEQLASDERLQMELDDYLDAEEDRLNPLSEWQGITFAALASLGMDIRYILIGERSLIMPSDMDID